jgi:hypothetical protein
MVRICSGCIVFPPIHRSYDSIDSRKLLLSILASLDSTRSPRGLGLGDEERLYESPRSSGHVRRDTHDSDVTIPKTLSAESLGVSERAPVSPMAKSKSLERGLVSPRQRLSSDVTSDRRHYHGDTSSSPLSPRDEADTDDEKRRQAKKDRRSSAGKVTSKTKVSVKQLDMAKMKTTGSPVSHASKESSSPTSHSERLDRKDKSGSKTERYV